MTSHTTMQPGGDLAADGDAPTIVDLRQLTKVYHIGVGVPALVNVDLCIRQADEYYLFPKQPGGNLQLYVASCFSEPRLGFVTKPMI